MRRWNSSTAMRSGTVTITPAPMIVPWMPYRRISLVPSSTEVREQAWRRCLTGQRPPRRATFSSASDLAEAKVRRDP